MKRLLRFFVVLSVVAFTSVFATSAYFTSTVNATDNLIQTGTLRAAIYTSFGGSNWWVAYDNGVSSQMNQPLQPVENVKPGDNNNRFFAVANHTTGSLPFKYQLSLDGSWDDPSTADDSWMTYTLERVAQNGSTCATETDCANLKSYLETNGFTEAAGSFSTIAPAGTNFSSSYLTMNQSLAASPHEFTIYRLKLNLSTSADNTAQGSTFRYAVNLNATQTNNPGWTQ